MNNQYVAGVADELPADLCLEFAGPNPSSGTARLSLTLPRPGDVRVVLYDVTGRVVNTLTNGWLAAGRHTIAWNGQTEAGSAAPAGLYFVRAQSGGRSVTRGLVRVR